MAQNDVIVGTWAGRDNFKCPHCKFDSLDRETTESHILETHLKAGCRRPIKQEGVPANPYLRVQPQEVQEEVTETVEDQSDNQL